MRYSVIQYNEKKKQTHRKIVFIGFVEGKRAKEIDDSPPTRWGRCYCPCDCSVECLLEKARLEQWRSKAETQGLQIHLKHLDTSVPIHHPAQHCRLRIVQKDTAEARLPATKSEPSQPKFDAHHSEMKGEDGWPYWKDEEQGQRDYIHDQVCDWVHFDRKESKRRALIKTFRQHPWCTRPADLRVEEAEIHPVETLPNRTKLMETKR